MSNNDYTTGNLLDFAYYEKYYKLIAIDLSKQTMLQQCWSINVFYHRKIRRNNF